MPITAAAAAAARTIASANSSRAAAAAAVVYIESSSVTHLNEAPLRICFPTKLKLHGDKPGVYTLVGVLRRVVYTADCILLPSYVSTFQGLVAAALHASVMYNIPYVTCIPVPNTSISLKRWGTNSSRGGNIDGNGIA